MNQRDVSAWLQRATVHSTKPANGTDLLFSIISDTVANTHPGRKQNTRVHRHTVEIFTLE